MRRAEQVPCKIQICKVCKILLGESQRKRILQKTSVGKYTTSRAESVANLSMLSSGLSSPLCILELSRITRIENAVKTQLYLYYTRC